jgi:hypothetical protein
MSMWWKHTLETSQTSALWLLIWCVLWVCEITFQWRICFRWNTVMTRPDWNSNGDFVNWTKQSETKKLLKDPKEYVPKDLSLKFDFCLALRFFYLNHPNRLESA